MKSKRKFRLRGPHRSRKAPAALGSVRKSGISIVVPGLGPREIQIVLSDYTGTLSCGGKLVAGVRECLLELSKSVDLHILTIDTFGTAKEQLRGLPLRLRWLMGAGGDHDVQKRQYLDKFEARRVAVLGNGNTDRLLLKAVKERGGLAIAVDNGEGCALDTMQNANIFVVGASNALGLLLQSDRLRATLRF